MSDKHCKDVTEDMFRKNDFHHQVVEPGEEQPEPAPGMEPLDYQHLMEKQRLAKLQKTAEGESQT